MSTFFGITENNKPSSNDTVLRPPGGGSSDIFASEMPQTPRSVKNHMQSNIFSCEKNAVKNTVRQGAHRFYFIGDQPRRGQKNVDSYARLFGEPERPMTPAKNHLKSNIPFGGNKKAAQQILVNGNGLNHHVNGKAGSVSSASSSVSSSTENLKMNGFSKIAFRKMINQEPTQAIAKPLIIPDLACPVTPPEVSSEPEPPKPLDIDFPCKEDSQTINEKDVIPEKTDKSGTETTHKVIQPSISVCGPGDAASQTNNETGCNTDNPNSLINMSPPKIIQEPQKPCNEDERSSSRNPITGMGLDGDGVGGLKPVTPKCRRDGNPVTGEGYNKPSLDGTPSLNGAREVINKNRIPPGGFSSGLW
ncbi:microtubule-associated protein Jupiter isoform X3 [Teleopsis dalmanni]|uniref:microtubule-associated protein Jupiter isoform X3 n=1 Tax=Teleopsis dalmanni TaxID=139649 RepID=UPI0018CDD3C4|nr:microtubule-associated protein Jupiter isoform X3 [Teleopsis dalmanni]